MKDFFGNKLEIGDTVAFEEPNYRNLIAGTILAFTPQKVRLEYFVKSIKRNTTFLTRPQDVVKKLN